MWHHKNYMKFRVFYQVENLRFDAQKIQIKQTAIIVRIFTISEFIIEIGCLALFFVVTRESHIESDYFFDFSLNQRVKRSTLKIFLALITLTCAKDLFVENKLNVNW